MPPKKPNVLTLPPPDADILATDLVPIGKPGTMGPQNLILQQQLIVNTALLQEVRQSLKEQKSMIKALSARFKSHGMKADDNGDDFLPDEEVVESLVEPTREWESGSVGKSQSRTYRRTYHQVKSAPARAMTTKWFNDVAAATEPRRWSENEKIAYFERVSRVLDSSKSQSDANKRAHPSKLLTNTSKHANEVNDQEPGTGQERDDVYQSSDETSKMARHTKSRAQGTEDAFEDDSEVSRPLKRLKQGRLPAKSSVKQSVATEDDSDRPLIRKRKARSRPSKNHQPSGLLELSLQRGSGAGTFDDFGEKQDTPMVISDDEDEDERDW